MRARLRMYLGDASIGNLEHYLNGYAAALWVHQIVEEDVPSFHQFLSWLERTREGTWNCGWANGLFAQSQDNDEAVERFFSLAAEFGSHRVVEGETLDLKPGHARSRAYTRLNPRTWPLPEKLQLMYLQPGGWCYLRSWYGGIPDDGRWLHPSADGVVHLVEWEYDIPQAAWGIPIPPRDEHIEALHQRWEAHCRAQE